MGRWICDLRCFARNLFRSLCSCAIGACTDRVISLLLHQVSRYEMVISEGETRGSKRIPKFAYVNQVSS